MSREEGDLMEGLLEEMEDEILAYHLLVEELRRQSAYLRERATDSLMESLQTVEILAGDIHKKHEKADKMAEMLLISKGRQIEEKGVAGLLSRVSSSEGGRIREKQITLASLRKRIVMANHRNKEFARESLACCREVFFFLTETMASSPVYIQNGKTQTTSFSPMSLNRKV